MRHPTEEPTLKSLKADKESLLISWSDGATHRILWRTMREECPCATCRQKRNEPPAPPPVFNILKPEEAAPLRATAMFPVGNYAYQVNFSDGHNSGIFTLEQLRDLGESENTL